jgi:NTE family protein
MSDASSTAPHVTLVLGAGGPVGHAFHIGVLRALADGCGWDARSADVIIGTSTGAQIGALLRAGWDARRMLARVAPPSPPPLRAGRVRWPASRRYLRAVLAQPRRARLGAMVAALLPEGKRDTAHLGEAFGRLFTGRWPLAPLWIPAVHVDSGARVVFGRGDAPLVDVGTAVRCSSAVPGLRRPVQVGARRYVDGAMVSPTHADLAAEGAPASPARRRVVVVLSPLSRYAPLRLLLGWELRALATLGLDVVAFEPDRRVVAAMGWNPFDLRAGPAVAEAAYRSTLARLGGGPAAAICLILGAGPGTKR